MYLFKKLIIILTRNMKMMHKNKLNKSIHHLSTERSNKSTYNNNDLKSLTIKTGIYMLFINLKIDADDLKVRYFYFRKKYDDDSTFLEIEKQIHVLAIYKNK